MSKKKVEEAKLRMSELDEGLIILSSLAAEKMGIPLPLFVNQALQEKLLRMMDKADPPAP
ncbi:hypothetical protein HF209_30440 [Pseudomonas sp. WS 5096]|uniref:Uncharacterized protein n=1 Tax=Pseudomonas cremoris TaxID=2724178 RepID=A0ABR6TH34_9PSED|nr:hypothetical protein [Pseudomonas cremoris]MBC2385276.1 hypothetical protein [Pseudomonas cremoris]